MADAQDLKSWASKMACGFESRLRHHHLKSLVFEDIHGLAVEIEGGCCHLRGQVFARGGHGEFAVFDALGGNEFIGNFADDRRLAAHEQNFQAVMVVEMDVDSRKNDVVMVVLDVGQRFLHMHFVVVVDEGDGAGDFRAAELLAVLDELVPDHIGDGEGAVVVALFAGHLVQLLEQGAGQRNAETGGGVIVHAP